MKRVANIFEIAQIPTAPQFDPAGGSQDGKKEGPWDAPGKSKEATW